MIFIWILVPIAVLVISELPYVLTYGWYVDCKYIEEQLGKHKAKGVHLNSLNSDIIQVGNMPTIFKVRGSIFSRWYIQNVGLIPKRSKVSKEIDSMHREQLFKLC